MAQVTIYKEGITKTRGLVVGGLKLPFRSMRASWAGVGITIDDGEELHLRSTEPRVIDLAPGSHRFVARRHGFVTGALVTDVPDDSRLIILISPDHRTSVTPDTPLGTLLVCAVDDPQDLQPYAFYKGLPSSWGRRSVARSVIISVAASLLFAVAGVASLVAAVYGFTQGAKEGVCLTFCAAIIAPVCIPAGVGGVVTAIRFRRLPPAWRNPDADGDLDPARVL